MKGPTLGFMCAGAAATHLRGTAIWCDAARAGAVSFVSRADVPLGRGRAERVVATEETAGLCRRLGRAFADPLLPRFGRPFAIGRLRLELLPSGRSAGAAQLHVELGSWRGVYAGSVWPRAGLGALPLQVRPCDELVLDGPSVGVADSAETIAVRLDAAAQQRLSVETDDLAVLEHLKGRVHAGPALRRLEPRRKATRVGALQVVAGLRDREDESCLALGDAATLEELVCYARDTGARRVWVRASREGAGTRVGVESLVAALREDGIDAMPFGPPEQLSLFAGRRSKIPRNDA
ncbi:MAG: hypothetical protein ABI321_18105 [Polyangia bacterium]